MAPRIKELRGQIEDLETRRSELLDDTHTGHGHGVTIEEVARYTQDLKLLLSKGTLMERKSFIRSFVKRIEIKDKEVLIEYTLPLATNKKELLTEEVLPLVKNGGPSVT